MSARARELPGEDRGGVQAERVPVTSLKGLERIVYETAAQRGCIDGALQSLFVTSGLSAGPKGLRFVPPVEGFHNLPPNQQFDLIFARPVDPSQHVPEKEALQGEELDRALAAFADAIRTALPVEKHDKADEVIGVARQRIASGGMIALA